MQQTNTQQARLDEILARLREREFRITPQRIAILKAFLQSQEHPGVEQVYAEVKAYFPTTSLATVYKTVNLLKEIQEIFEIVLADGGNRYDGNRPYPHPHLVCTECRKVVDSDFSQLEQVTAEVAAATGYRIESHQVEFFGVCPACQQS